MTAPTQTPTEFDAYAQQYDSMLAHALSVTGESKEYYARGRISFLADCLKALQARPRRVLDFGCGLGSATPIIRELLQPTSVVGVDPSHDSIRVADERFSDAETRFVAGDVSAAGTGFDLAYCNCVLHHVQPEERDVLLRGVRDALVPGGYFSLWENNPWNPGTRLCMSRCAFDRTAIVVSAPATRRLLRRAGFEIVRTDFLFIFPRPLAALRWLERPLSRLPLGGQYQVLARRR